jgi:hypothetical protein
MGAGFNERRPSIGSGHVHADQEQALWVAVELGGGPEASDQR